MFADQTLTPKEAMRLCALGLVAEQPQRYAALAAAVRHFCGRVAGPSLDLMGTSIELLRYEGLVTALDGRGMEDDALLALSEAGNRELMRLLTARLRPSSDLNRLIVALKMRFLHLLAAADRQAQLAMLADHGEADLARLEDLAASADHNPTFQQWLAHELTQSRHHLAWLLQLVKDDLSTP
jgi:DNA-binding PadR family transcriptional regulator